ncbi:MAG: hypothetical protein JNL08_02295 [Planctomycetes bacterium]|nr:hypothetical protein [Planctomycetota bacterium]
MMRIPSTPVLSLFLSGLLTGATLAQASVVVPEALATLPGNARLSLPLRWSHGTLQVRIDAGLLPAALQGQTLSGLWLRRPSFLGEPAVPALTRTLTVRGAFQPETANQLGNNLLTNRPANLTTLFGPAPVTAAASAGTGPATALGADHLHIVFSQALPVGSGSLFLEFETANAPLQVSADHWVDGVWVPFGVDDGWVATVGDGSCTTRPEPTELRWNDPDGPDVGDTARFEVTGALPAGASAGLVLFWIGVDPQTTALGPTHFGFGTSLAPIDPGLTGCHWWAPYLITWFGVTDATGRIETTLPLTTGVQSGMKLGVQAAWLDETRPGLPFSLSNGLLLTLNGIGVGSQCGSVYFPGATTTSPWGPYGGQMPVLRLEY